MWKFLTYSFWGQIIWIVFGSILLILVIEPSSITASFSAFAFVALVARVTILWGLILGALVFIGMLLGGLIQEELIILILPVLLGAAFGIVIGVYVIPSVADTAGLGVRSLATRLIFSTVQGVLATPLIIRFASRTLVS